MNAEISAFSSGDLNLYEFIKRIDFSYKPNALDKARFEFSPLGKKFNTGLDKNAQGYQEEGIIKLLKDIRDGLAGNVIIPARPPRPDNNGNDKNGNDNNGNDKTSFIDLSWMIDLQLYKNIASEVFSRYNGDKNSFELFTLRIFIDNINNERVKNKKDAREEFKNVKKNVKSEALKEIVKDLEQAIFGDDDNDESLIEGLNKDILEQEELGRRFKNLISKKRCESLREYLKESKDANRQDRVNALKEYLKESKDVNPQDRVNILKKKLNNLFKTISEDNNNNNDNDDSEDNNNNNDNDDSEDNNNNNDNDDSEDNNNNNDNDDSEDNYNNNDNDDSEDNQIRDFVDEVLKKVSKEIVNYDPKKVSKEIVNDDAKKKSNQKSKKKY